MTSRVTREKQQDCKSPTYDYSSRKKNESNLNKYAKQCTNKKEFPDSNLLSSKKNCQLKENLRGWNSQMNSKSVD